MKTSNNASLKLVEKSTSKNSIRKNQNNFIKSINIFILQEAFQLYKPSKAICIGDKMTN